MNHPEDWTQKQVDDFYQWVADQPAFRDQLAEDPPNLADDLAGRGLRREEAEELARLLKWLRVLPFADQRAGREILFFYYTEFLSIKRRLANDARGQRLCALFLVLARMMFQGTSLFPERSTQRATGLVACLRHYPRGADAFVPLATLFTDRASGRFRHGYNANELPREQLNTLIKSEHLRRARRFQEVYRAPEKYEGYQTRLLANQEFRQDWGFLKETFRRELPRGKVVLRSEARGPFRTAPRPRGGASPRADFQDVFDCFCWKWFLDGMEGDEPLVAKLSFAVTPFGTTVFIPGYWSFDPKRDLKWKELLSFHRSRGVKRQGEAFEPNRRDREGLERILLDAEQVSNILNESGAALVARCIRMAGLPTHTDASYIYRVLREAKRGPRRAPPVAEQEELPGLEDHNRAIQPDLPRSQTAQTAKASSPPKTQRARQEQGKAKRR